MAFNVRHRGLGTGQVRALAAVVKCPPGRRNRDLKTVAKTPRAAQAVFKRALVICCLIAPLAIVPIATANAGTASASDNFARANGSLGPNWTNMADGGLTIVNQQVQGTNSGATPVTSVPPRPIPATSRPRSS